MIEVGKTYRLRGGLSVRITVTDIKGSKRPIGAYINHGDHDEYQSWYPNGRAWDGTTLSHYDIIMPEPERKSLWANFYSDGAIQRALDTRASADDVAFENRTHLLEIITENGEPVDVKIHKVER